MNGEADGGRDCPCSPSSFFLHHINGDLFHAYLVITAISLNRISEQKG